MMDPNLPGLPAYGGSPPEELRRALAAKGPGYEPRTAHRELDGSPRYTNRLILETSPYLLQHAHNPVSWYAWGPEPFERARREHKLVFLSVGYSTCHWCHVMERESFEDLEIATYLNEHFVAIKLDREERPDVDGVYMATVQLLTGRGGWPMTVVTTPEREPVFAGMYFPPRDGDRGIGIGLFTILRELQEGWRKEPAAFEELARANIRRVRFALGAAPPGGVPGAETIRRAAERLIGEHDPIWGGFSGAPKFPRSQTLELLARYHRRTGDARALGAAVRTLERMAAGGIHDQIGGGFHRYVVDEAWRVPHFEKMLYDNAQLATAYLELYQITGRVAFAGVVRGTLEYLAREMTHEAGGLFSASDAESLAPSGLPEEGRFYTWTREELEVALGPELARLAALHWGITSERSAAERTVPHLAQPVEEVAAVVGEGPEETARALDRARLQLRAVRERRPAPARDEKIVTAWNGLAISAFARAGFALDEPDYLRRAVRAAAFVLERLLVAGRLHRSYHEEQARHPACLDDYAFFIQALLDLDESTGDPRWLSRALELQAVLDDELWDDDGGGYFLSAGGVELPVREKPSYDGAEPSGNSVAALNLLRLEQLTGEVAWRRRAERLFEASAAALRRGVGLPKMLVALDFYLDEPLQIAVVTPRGDAAAPALLEPLRRSFVPNRVLAVVGEQELERRAARLPWLAGKRAAGGLPTAYVCRFGSCGRPATDSRELERQLEQVKPYSSGRLG